MKQGRRAKSSFCIINGHMSCEDAELETKHQKYKGRVVLRGDIVKDDRVLRSIH